MTGIIIREEIKNETTRDDIASSTLFMDIIFLKNGICDKKEKGKDCNPLPSPKYRFSL
jgi:hypothetical protein